MLKKGMPLFSSTRRELLISLALSIVVLLSGAGLTAFIAYTFDQAEAVDTKRTFEVEVASYTRDVERGVETQADALHAVSGLFAASNKIQRDEYDAFLSRLKIKERFPGIVVMSYLQVIRGDEKEDFIEEIRNDTTVEPKGYPDFTVFPDGERNFYVVSKYSYPENPDRTLFGYDIFTEPNRAMALQAAMDLGELTISAPVQLLEQGGGKLGILMLLPDKERDAQGIERTVGFVAGSLRAEAFFEGVIATHVGRLVMLRAVDRLSGIPLFTSPGFEQAHGKPGFTSTKTVTSGGRVWDLEFYAPSTFITMDNGRGSTRSFIVFGGGAASVLLFLLFLSLSVSRVRGIQMVENTNQEIHSARLRSDTSFKELRAVVDNLTIGIVVVDGDGRAMLVNRGGKDILGVTEEAGAEFLDRLRRVKLLKANGTAYPFEELPTVMALREGNKAVKEDVVAEKVGGGQMLLRATAIPVKAEGGRVDFVVTVFEDITVQKERERQNSEFISIASHQMRSGLANVKWMSELFKETKGKLTKKQQEIIRDIFNANARMNRLVNDLLNVTRLDLGKIQLKHEAVDLAAVISDVIEECAATAKQKKVKIVFKPGKQPKVKTDPGLIREVVLNLVSNAVKYTSNGTAVTVAMKKKDQGLEFSITDEGIGIPPAEVGNLFRPFFRASNVETAGISGTGMGLYISKKIVELSGGTIWVQTKEGKGSVFGFQLPLADDAA